MYVIEMDLLSNPVFLSVLVGFVGALSRFALQWFRDEALNQTWQKSVALLFLGCVGGWLSYATNGVYAPAACWALGFSASDVIENLADTLLG